MASSTVCSSHHPSAAMADDHPDRHRHQHQHHQHQQQQQQQHQQQQHLHQVALAPAAKWGMTVDRRLAAGCSANAAWAMIADFGGLRRWVPHVGVCEIVEGGEPGAPGCVRYVASASRRADGSPERWVREKLLDFSPATRSFSYAMLDNSYGFAGYTTTISVRTDRRRLLPMPHADTGPDHGAGNDSSSDGTSNDNSSDGTSNDNSSDSTSNNHSSDCDSSGSDCIDHPDAASAPVISWRFELDPVPHRSQHDVLAFLASVFERMMVSLESTLLASPPPACHPTPTMNAAAPR